MHVSMMYLSLMHVSMRQSVAVPEFFRVPVPIFGIKFFRHRFRYFFCTKFYLYRFRYLVSVLNFSGVRYHLKPKKNPGTGMSHSESCIYDACTYDVGLWTQIQVYSRILILTMTRSDLSLADQGWETCGTISDWFRFTQVRRGPGLSRYFGSTSKKLPAYH